MDVLDTVQLNFSTKSLWLLNICLGFIMFGVALSLNVDSFRRIFQQPKSVILGALSQFLLLPAFTFLLVCILQPSPSVALGMILVAACPGGNISNFMSLLAKGNAELSVSLTAIATLLAIILTPLNFTFWGNLYEPAATLLNNIHLDPLEMFKVVLLLLGIPLILGMWVASQFPRLTQRILRPVRWLSILIFGGFVVIAFSANLDIFIHYIHKILLIVLLHNAIAFIIGYSWGALWRLPEKDRRSLSIETGIQNSGLGLILIFNFFDGLGGMAIVAAWWGIWHILSGLAVAFTWSKVKGF